MIATDIKALTERLVIAYRDSGGEPDAVFVCNSHVHREYLDSAAAVLGYPVQVREWVPTPNTLLEPVSALRAQDKVYAEMDCTFSEVIGVVASNYRIAGHCCGCPSQQLQGGECTCPAEQEP